MKEFVGILAVILTFVGYAPYIWDTVKGKTKPHIYSWFTWAFVTFIIFALQIFGKGGAGAYTTLATAILCLIIFLLGLKNGNKDITRFDTVTFIISLIATAVWIFAKQPIISTFLIVTINTLANLPTIRKSWNDPHSETLFTWQMGAVRNFLGIIALQNYSILTWLYPVTNLIINIIESCILIIRRKQLKNI
ncbi:MAG: hypothetical protein QY322_00475 [bacterium]|nr:MAG: hypothetical protein QY322_00475 [bacterium]